MIVETPLDLAARHDACDLHVIVVHEEERSVDDKKQRLFALMRALRYLVQRTDRAVECPPSDARRTSTHSERVLEGEVGVLREIERGGAHAVELTTRDGRILARAIQGRTLSSMLISALAQARSRES